MEKLFAYGTLMDSSIQLKLFGKLIRGKSDILIDYKKSNIVIDGEIFLCADFSSGDKIEGLVLEINLNDLAVADEYEGLEYKRMKIILASGTEAWLYTRT